MKYSLPKDRMPEAEATLHPANEHLLALAAKVWGPAGGGTGEFGHMTEFIALQG
jgi:hypothetical protein